MEGTFKRLLGNCKSGIDTLKQLEGSFEIIADKKPTSLPAAPPPPKSTSKVASSSSSSMYAQGPRLGLSAQGPGLGQSSSNILRSQSILHPPRDPVFLSELEGGDTVMGVDKGGSTAHTSRSTVGTPYNSSSHNNISSAIGSTGGQLRFKIPTRAAKELLSDADQTVADAVLASTTRTSFSRGET